jgi:hypothetical protein
MNNLNRINPKKLLEQVENIGGKIPDYGNYHIVGLQNTEKTSNIFNDSFYVYHGPTHIHSSTGSTNFGKTALIHFEDCKLKGFAEWKTNQSVPNCFKPSLYKGRVKLLKANSKIIYCKSNNSNSSGEFFYGNILANMKGVDYNPYSQLIKQNINGWSFATQVWNNMSDYRLMTNALWARNKPVQYTLLKDW